MINKYALIEQVKGSEIEILRQFLSKMLAIEPIEHKSLAGLLQQQDKEFRDLMKIHAREILDFKEAVKSESSENRR